MNVTVERVGNDATLKITLPAEEVNKGFKKAVAKIAGQVNIPVKAKPPAILSKCTMAKKQ